MDNLNREVPFVVERVICIRCLHRWNSTHPAMVLLENIECPECGKTGGVIRTGDELNEVAYPRPVSEEDCKHWKINPFKVKDKRSEVRKIISEYDSYRNKRGIECLTDKIMELFK